MRGLWSGGVSWESRHHAGVTQVAVARERNELFPATLPRRALLTSPPTWPSRKATYGPTLCPESRPVK